MKDTTEEFADMIYILIEVECGRCHKRFAEPEGSTEAEVWSWAQKTASAAIGAGWRLCPDMILCPDCLEL